MESRKMCNWLGMRLNRSLGTDTQHRMPLRGARFVPTNDPSPIDSPCPP
jgi:hypothetical protein